MTKGVRTCRIVSESVGLCRIVSEHVVTCGLRVTCWADRVWLTKWLYHTSLPFVKGSVVSYLSDILSYSFIYIKNIYKKIYIKIEYTQKRIGVPSPKAGDWAEWAKMAKILENARENMQSRAKVETKRPYDTLRRVTMLYDTSRHVTTRITLKWTAILRQEIHY